MVFARTRQNLQVLVDDLAKEYGKWGLKINFRKTEYLAAQNRTLDDLVDDGEICRRVKFCGCVLCLRHGYSEESRAGPESGKNASPRFLE